MLEGATRRHAGSLAWLYLTLYLVSDRGLDPQHAGRPRRHAARGAGQPACLGGAVPGHAGRAGAAAGRRRRPGRDVRRREAMALTRSISNAGFVVGPPLGALLFTVDFNLVFYVDAATSVLLALLVWAKVP